jgi:hypothetical protein
MTDVRPAHEYVPTPGVFVADPPPTLEAFAANLYASLAPLAWMDDQTEWSLAKFSGAFGEMFEAVEDVARDTAQGPGWSAVVDITRCPLAWLPWLAQFVGVIVPVGLAESQARAYVTSHDNFKRGTPAAIRTAAQLHLTGTKTVLVQERLGGDPYALSVYTLDVETPSGAQTLADVLTQKPGGIVLTYTRGPANTYAAMTAGYATYTAVGAAFSNYTHLAANQPG